MLNLLVINLIYLFQQKKIENPFLKKRQQAIQKIDQNSQKSHFQIPKNCSNNVFLLYCKNRKALIQYYTP